MLPPGGFDCPSSIQWFHLSSFRLIMFVHIYYLVFVEIIGFDKKTFAKVVQFYYDLLKAIRTVASCSDLMNICQLFQ